jgi:hypothetical protein
VTAVPGYSGLSDPGAHIPPYPGPLFSLNPLVLQSFGAKDIPAPYDYDGEAYLWAWSPAFVPPVSSNNATVKMTLVALEAPMAPVGGVQEWTIDQVRADSPETQQPRVIFIPPVRFVLRCATGVNAADFFVSLVPRYGLDPQEHNRLIARRGSGRR